MVLHLRRVWEMILPAFFLLCILYSNACLVVFPVRLWSWSSLVSIIERAEWKKKAKDLPSFLSKTRLPLSHRLCYRQRRLHIMDLLIYSSPPCLLLQLVEGYKVQRCPTNDVEDSKKRKINIHVSEILLIFLYEIWEGRTVEENNKF